MASNGRLSRADGMVAAAASAYLAWSFVPRWYRSGGEDVLGIPLPGFSFDAWEGVTRLSAILSVIALAWVGLRVGRARAGAGPVDLGLAGLATLLTLAGVVSRRPAGSGEAEPSWGLLVAVPIALAWSYAGWRRYRETRTRASGAKW